MQREWAYYIDVVASRIDPAASTHFRAIAKRIDAMRRARWELVSIIAGPQEGAIRHYILTFRHQVIPGDDPIASELPQS